MATSRPISMRFDPELLQEIDAFAKREDKTRSAAIQTLLSEGLGLTGGPRRAAGPVERKVRSDLEALVNRHPMGEALAEMSLTLARQLDRAPYLLSNQLAPINKELRANLVELASFEEPSGGDDDDELLSGPLFDDPESD